MALKKQDEQSLNTIANFINGMLSQNIPLDVAKIASKEAIQSFEDETKHKVNIKPSEDGKSVFISTIDTTKNYFRVRNSNESQKVIRVKINDVEIDVKSFKEGKFEHSNADMANALVMLADRLRLSEEVNGVDHGDLQFLEVQEHESDQDQDQDAHESDIDSEEDLYENDELKDSLDEDEDEDEDDLYNLTEEDEFERNL